MSILGSHEYARGPKDIDTVMMLSAEIGKEQLAHELIPPSSS